MVARNGTTDNDDLAPCLWMCANREWLRIMLSIVICGSSPLVIWAFVDIFLKIERGFRGVDFDLVVINAGYLFAVILFIFFFLFSINVKPQNKACELITAGVYVSQMVVVNLTTVSCFHKTLISTGPTPSSYRRYACVRRTCYIFFGVCVPCLLLTAIMFTTPQMHDYTMCWLHRRSIYWLVIPVMASNSILFTIGAFALLWLQTTPHSVRCYVYSNFLTSLLFSVIIILYQVDLQWSNFTNGFASLVLFCFFNLLVWLHYTNALIEFCPCSQDHPATPPVRPQEFTLGEDSFQPGFFLLEERVNPSPNPLATIAETEPLSPDNLPVVTSLDDAAGACDDVLSITSNATGTSNAFPGTSVDASITFVVFMPSPKEEMENEAKKDGEV